MLILLLACHDLPEGWENAQPVEDFHQEECAGSAYDTGVVVSVDAQALGDATDLAVGSAHFRCAQEVEGFWRDASDGAEVLIQPVDMDPWGVAACDCLYDLSMTVPTRTDFLRVFSRGDHQSGRDEPELIGSTEVGG